MKEHFQLFCGDMVKAILAGLKNMTRRLVTPENSLIDTRSARTNAGKALWAKLDWSRAKVYAPMADFGDPSRDAWWVPEIGLPDDSGHTISPYVRTGDLLIGKETFFDVRPNREALIFQGLEQDFLFRADDVFIGCHAWRPSIFMPKSASRLRLEVTDTFAERLQTISPKDCEREGTQYPVRSTEVPGKVAPVIQLTGKFPPMRYLKKDEITHETLLRAHYAALWNTLNDRDGVRWEDNPPVWVKTFKRV